MLCGLMLKGRKWKDALKAARNATKTAKTLGNQELEVESQLLEAKVSLLIINFIKMFKLTNFVNTKL